MKKITAFRIKLQGHIILLTIPKPSISRLCRINRILEECQQKGVERISSAKIAERLAINSHNIRKDISYLGEIGDSGSGYDVKKLKSHIAERLGLFEKRKVCVVGLGRLGTSIMNNERFLASGYRIVAGFDSNVNRLETMKTTISVYPSYDIINIVKRDGIELAVLTVPPHAAQEVANRLLEGGIKGIVNFTTVVLKTTSDVYIRNVDMGGELDVLSALITLNKNNH